MNKKFIIGVSLFLVLIISLFFGFNNFKSSGEPQNNSLAKIEVLEKIADLGTMKINEEKYYDFKIKNVGQDNLKIYQVGTSCNCTFAKIFINGQESPEFNMPMHNSISAMRWVGEILPGNEATVRLIYKPYIMPVFGNVERSVIFKTNDPSNPKVELMIKTFVTK